MIIIDTCHPKKYKMLGISNLSFLKKLPPKLVKVVGQMDRERCLRASLSG